MVQEQSHRGTETQRQRAVASDLPSLCLCVSVALLKTKGGEHPPPQKALPEI